MQTDNVPVEYRANTSMAYEHDGSKIALKEHVKNLWYFSFNVHISIMLVTLN